MNVYSHPNPDCDLMIFKGNISCYILLLKSLLTLENTKFIAGELSLIFVFMRTRNMREKELHRKQMILWGGYYEELRQIK